jgi:hypothetical protein
MLESYQNHPIQNHPIVRRLQDQDCQEICIQLLVSQIIIKTRLPFGDALRDQVKPGG